MHICVRVSEVLGLELQTGVSYNVKAWNRTWVLLKNS